MGFTTRRGRPPKSPERVDLGTPELRFKQACGVTAEPIDLCRDRQLITPQQHWSGLHLRWLYTIRYGAPHLTTHYGDAAEKAGNAPDDPTWRQSREAEYHAATALLQQQLHYEPVMRLCIYNEQPRFLLPRLQQNAWKNIRLAEQLAAEHRQLCDGLELLCQHWKQALPCGKHRAGY